MNRIYKERIERGPNHTEVVRQQIDTDETTVQNNQPAYYMRRPAAASVVYFLLDIVEVLLLVRFLMRLFGANSAAAFTNFIYRLTDPLVAPFRGIFPTTSAQGMVVDWTTILAAIVYAIVAWIIARIIWAAESSALRTQ